MKVSSELFWPSTTGGSRIRQWQTRCRTAGCRRCLCGAVHVPDQPTPGTKCSVQGHLCRAARPGPGSGGRQDWAEPDQYYDVLAWRYECVVSQGEGALKRFTAKFWMQLKKLPHPLKKFMRFSPGLHLHIRLLNISKAKHSISTDCGSRGGPSQDALAVGGWGQTDMLKGRD